MVTTSMPTESIPTPNIYTPASLEDGRPQLSPQETLDAARKVEEALQALVAPSDHLQPANPNPVAPDQLTTPDQVTTPNAPRTWEHLDGQAIAYGQPYGSEEPFKALVRFEREGDTLDWDANSLTNHEGRVIQMVVEDAQTGLRNNLLVRGNNVYIFKSGTPDHVSTYERITLFDTHDLPPATIGQPYAVEGVVNGQILPEQAGDKVLVVDVRAGGTNRDKISNANRKKQNSIMHAEDDLFADSITAADNVDKLLEQEGIPAIPGQVASVTLIDPDNGELKVVNESAVEAPVAPVDPTDAPTQPNQVPDPADAPTDPLDVADTTPDPDPTPVQNTPVDPPTQPMPTRGNEAPTVDNMPQATKDLLAWKAGRMPKAKRIPGVDPEANAAASDGRFEYEPTPNGDVYVVDAIWRPNTPVKWDAFPAARRLNRQILISTEDDKQYIVYGDRIYDLAASQEQGKPVSVELDVDEALPNATIGQPWQSKLGETNPIARVEILQQTRKQDGTDPAAGVDNPFWIAQQLRGDVIEQATKGQRSKVVQKAEAGAQALATRSPAAMKRALVAGARAAKMTGSGIMKANDKFYTGANKIGKAMGDVKERMAETVKVRNARIGAFVTAMMVEMPKAAAETEITRQSIEQDNDTEVNFAQGVMNAIYLRGVRLRREAEATKRAWNQRKDGEDDDDNSDPANTPW